MVELYYIVFKLLNSVMIFKLLFVMEIFSMENLRLGSLRSIAKIGGTVVCVSGAMCMALLRGPKLLNTTQGFVVKSTLFSVESGSHRAWLLGSLCLFGSCCCWSIWLILQVCFHFIR